MPTIDLARAARVGSPGRNRSDGHRSGVELSSRRSTTAVRAPGPGAGRASRSRLTWFGLSLGAALTQAVQFAVIKGRAREIPPVVIVAWTQAVACAAWIIFFLVTGHPFVPPGPAWPAVAASSILVLGMSGLLARASARGDISIVGPILALSPIFTILPDAVLSGGLPSGLGWLGLALSLAGTTSLSGGAGAGPVGRLRALFARRDALDALGAAFLLGFLAAVDRWAALALGPPSYLVSSHGATAALAILIVLVTNPRGLRGSFAPRNVMTLVGHGLLGVTGTGMQTSAMTMAPAAYVNAIRRMSAVVAVLLGRALFGEPDLTRRLTAALLAGLGAACLLLAK
ncbi:MAG: DMT family transporter [Candidatus Rokuibacteriota bacterium]